MGTARCCPACWRNGGKTDDAVSADARVRVDKWLWAARFYKTRALAQAAVVAGKVRLHDERIKPAKDVRVGDELKIRVGEFAWDVTVLALAEQRGPAEAA